MAFREPGVDGGLATSWAENLNGWVPLLAGQAFLGLITLGPKCECSWHLFWRKVCPGLEANSGMRFPFGACLGNCGTEFCLIAGYSFRYVPQLESVSRNSGSEWDGVSGR